MQNFLSRWLVLHDQNAITAGLHDKIFLSYKVNKLWKGQFTGSAARIVSRFGLSCIGRKLTKSPNLFPKTASNCTNKSHVCFAKPGLAGHNITRFKCPSQGLTGFLWSEFSIIPELWTPKLNKNERSNLKKNRRILKFLLFYLQVCHKIC